MTKPGDHVEKVGQAYMYWCSVGEHFVDKVSDKTKNITCCDPCWRRVEDRRKEVKRYMERGYW